MHGTRERDEGASNIGERKPAGSLSRFLQDPLGSIIAASAATIGSLGLVLSGIWFINLAIG